MSLVPEQNPQATPPPRRRIANFLVPVVIGLAIAAVFIYRDKKNGGGADGDLKASLVKAIRDHEGIEVKNVSLKQDDKVGNRPGQGYSGTVTLPTGEVATVEVWVEHYFNAKGGGDILHWTLKKPTTQGG